MQLKVIDVSEHQGVIDWEKVKPHIDGAIIRCGFGDDLKSQDDKQYARNVAECERLGIPYGVYLYSYANTMEHAKSEVAHVKRLLKGRKLSYPVYFDTENEGCEALSRKASEYFCNELEKAGYYAGVYTFESWYNANLKGLTKYTLWIAKFGANDGKPHTKPQIGATVDMWQYTSMATMPGVTVNTVDMNLCYKDFPALIGKVKTETAKAANGTVTKVLEVAESQIGKKNGTKYGEWYEKNIDKDTGNYDFGASGVAWCAMFVSWVFNQVKATCAGLPGAYCPTMLAAAKKDRKTVKVANAKPGDVVYFDWDGGVSDHVGIVERNDGKQLHTIEGNTDNGIVARKQRPYSTVAGVVRPNYAKSTKTQTETKSAKKPTAKKSLKVGAKVKIKQGAHIYGTTRTFAPFVYQTVYKVVEIMGNRVVFATTDGKTVIGAIAKKDCIVQ